MSENLENVKRRIRSAGDLHGVVKTMKSLAAVNIRQYEESVRSLREYARAVERGLHAALLGTPRRPESRLPRGSVVMVIGSDQGMVGQFNEIIVEQAVEAVRSGGGEKDVVEFWAAGARAAAGVEDRRGAVDLFLPLPSSSRAVTGTVSDIILRFEELRGRRGETRLVVFHNAPKSGASYGQHHAVLYPPEEGWLQDMGRRPWPRRGLPLFLLARERLLAALIGEHLFVSLYRAYAASMAAENAARLAAMQRAEKNIEEMKEELTATYNALRQTSITEELFDVVSGFEALTAEAR